DTELVNVVRQDLERTMNVSVSPEMVRVIRHSRGIPQYPKGHLARMHQIEALLKVHPGLLLAGNSYRGVSINACIADAPSVADAALRAIGAEAHTAQVETVSA